MSPSALVAVSSLTIRIVPEHGVTPLAAFRIHFGELFSIVAVGADQVLSPGRHVARDSVDAKLGCVARTTDCSQIQSTHEPASNGAFQLEATMAESNYVNVLPVTLKWEGGKVDHPKDPGGRTNQGVIQRVYDKYRSEKGLRTRDVYDMSDHERDEIYRKKYWDKVRGDRLPMGVDLAVFDYGVNSGPARAIRYLQKVVQVEIDGRFGQGTLNAVQRTSPVTIARRICDERLAFVQRLRTWKTFGRGWARRIGDVRARAVAMASRDVREVRKDAEEFEQKSRADQSVAKKTAPAGPAAAGTGVAADQAVGIDWSLIIGLGIFTAVAIGFAAFLWWRAQERREVAEAARLVEAEMISAQGGAQS